MLRLQFGIEDIASVRFAISPVAEAVGALRLLGDRDRTRPLPPWVRPLATARDNPSLAPLAELVAPHGYCPDFLTPAALGPGR